jgi:peptidoglycan hydrolase CwlO-like protein
MTQQTNRDVLYSLQHETPSKSLNDDAAREIERLQDLVLAVRVAPFISADESLRRCREAADEIERFDSEIKQLTKEIDVLRAKIRVARR